METSMLLILCLVARVLPLAGQQSGLHLISGVVRTLPEERPVDPPPETTTSTSTMPLDETTQSIGTTEEPGRQGKMRKVLYKVNRLRRDFRDFSNDNRLRFEQVYQQLNANENSLQELKKTLENTRVDILEDTHFIIDLMERWRKLSHNITVLFERYDQLTQTNEKLVNSSAEASLKIHILTQENDQIKKESERVVKMLEVKDEEIHHLRYNQSNLHKKLNNITKLVKEEDVVPPGVTHPDPTPLYPYRKIARDCSSIEGNGVMTIELSESQTSEVYCRDGWLLIQRRLDGSVDFDRDWADYRRGFGHLRGEFYLGNDLIHRITNRDINYKLRIELSDWHGQSVAAEYSPFRIESEKEYYKLRLGKYNGTAGAKLYGLKKHDGQNFTTFDRDNSKHVAKVVDDDYDDISNIIEQRLARRAARENCAQKYSGGWWWIPNQCHPVNLNGRYFLGGSSPYGQGIVWYGWKNDYHYSLKATEMKIRPMDDKEVESRRARRHGKSRPL